MLVEVTQSNERSSSFNTSCIEELGSYEASQSAFGPASTNYYLVTSSGRNIEITEESFNKLRSLKGGAYGPEKSASSNKGAAT